MRNPWLDIPLVEHEGHMALSHVGQAQLLADVLERVLKKYGPQSVAILGCAGGNGFERIQTNVTQRVVGIDINPEYVQRVQARFQERLPALELFVAGIQTTDLVVDPVELVYAALLLEYADVNLVLKRLRVVQLPHSSAPAVTPSRYLNIQKLAPHMKLLPPAQLRKLARTHGFAEIESACVQSAGGKRFQMQLFHRLPGGA